MGTGCEEEDPFGHLRDQSSDTDDDDDDDDGDKNEDDKNGDDKDSSTGGSGEDDSDGKDSEGESTGGDDNTDDSNSDNTDGTDEKPPENKLCDLRPTSLAILGDASPAGVTVGGTKDDKNAFKILHGHLKSELGLSELGYENYASDGAKFVELDQKQMLEVSTSTDGPVMVVVHAGSHDLAGYLFKSDQDAKDDFDGEWVKSHKSLKNLVAHFENKDKFPKGATIVINTLYNPFDDCQEYYKLVIRVSEVKTELMGKFNQKLRDFAAEYDNIVIADQHPAFLGHGHHHDNEKCPHYKSGSDYLMKGGADNTNLSTKGHAFMGNVLKTTVDKMFKGCS